MPTDKVAKLDLSDIPARLRETGRTTLSMGESGEGAARYDLSVVGYLRCSRDGLITHANRAIVKWLGADSVGTLIGATVTSLLKNEAYWQEWRNIRESCRSTVDLKLRDGRLLSASVEARPVPEDSSNLELWVVVDLDNATIERVARLEASQRLTAGTVHDVNNVLTVLAGNLFLLTEKVRDMPELFESARRARNAAERGNSLLRELLDFNRGHDDEAKSISPGEHVMALKPLLARAVGSEYTLKVDVDRNAGSVKASPAQFESVIINLIVNARDAMEPGGTVTVSVGNAMLDDATAARHKLQPGEFVRLEVRDDGCGIPEKYLSRVTQPLFTTKTGGKGSGLGLAMVKRFVDEYHGLLEIKSRDGEGTQILVWLPLSGRAADGSASLTLPLSTLPCGDELLLLVMRDKDARDSLRETLEMLGYRVRCAADPVSVPEVLGDTERPAVVICQRDGEFGESNGAWLQTFRKEYGAVRHIAILQAGASAFEEAPDADGHIISPVSVPDLARGIRAVLEEA